MAADAGEPMCTVGHVFSQEREIQGTIKEMKEKKKKETKQSFWLTSINRKVSTTTLRMV